MSRAERCDYDRRMDVFADIGESSVVDLIAGLLLMAIWGGAGWCHSGCRLLGMVGPFVAQAESRAAMTVFWCAL